MDGTYRCSTKDRVEVVDCSVGCKKWLKKKAPLDGAKWSIEDAPDWLLRAERSRKKVGAYVVWVPFVLTSKAWLLKMLTLLDGSSVGGR